MGIGIQGAQREHTAQLGFIGAMALKSQVQSCPEEQDSNSNEGTTR